MHIFLSSLFRDFLHVLGSSILNECELLSVIYVEKLLIKLWSLFTSKRNYYITYFEKRFKNLMIQFGY